MINIGLNWVILTVSHLDLYVLKYSSLQHFWEYLRILICQWLGEWDQCIFYILISFSSIKWKFIMMRCRVKFLRNILMLDRFCNSFIAQDCIIPISLVVNYLRWPDSLNRSNIKIFLWNWHIIYPTFHLVVMFSLHWWNILKTYFYSIVLWNWNFIFWTAILFSELKFWGQNM